jgi:aryl-alcohol dehydrogenase-like predicted oxidoreductase
VHWPDRYVPLFGDEAYDAARERADDVAIHEQLAGLAAVVAAGKVRHVGLSNETPWGVAQFLAAAERSALPRVCSVQNSYSLLVRADFELGGMVETCAPRNGNVGLLAYSPLAGGVLTGKYQVRFRHSAAPQFTTARCVSLAQEGLLVLPLC